MDRTAILLLPLVLSACSRPSADHFGAPRQADDAAKPNQFQHVALVAAPDMEFAAAIESIDAATARARIHYWRMDLASGVIVDTVINDVRCGTPPPPCAIGIGNDTAILFPSYDSRAARFGLDLGYAPTGERLVGLATGGVALTVQVTDADALPWAPGPWPESDWFYIPLPLWPSSSDVADAITAHCGQP